jgi:hypothetical protein
VDPGQQGPQQHRQGALLPHLLVSQVGRLSLRSETAATRAALRARGGRLGPEGLLGQGQAPPPPCSDASQSVVLEGGRKPSVQAVEWFHVVQRVV